MKKSNQLTFTSFMRHDMKLESPNKSCRKMTSCANTMSIFVLAPNSGNSHSAIRFILSVWSRHPKTITISKLKLAMASAADIYEVFNNRILATNYAL